LQKIFALFFSVEGKSGA